MEIILTSLVVCFILFIIICLCLAIGYGLGLRQNPPSSEDT